MTDTDKLYYKEMLQRERLIPFFKDDKLICFVTFFITDDENKYVNAYAWEALIDNPRGRVCYVAQLLTDKEFKNRKLYIDVWRRFKVYIKTNFPDVRYITWRRWDREKEGLKTYKKEI
jgi:hypothetical protein